MWQRQDQFYFLWRQLIIMLYKVLFIIHWESFCCLKESQDIEALSELVQTHFFLVYDEMKHY